MAPVHVSPDGAVQAFVDLGAEQAIAIHFGTFQQGDDGLYEPADDLQKAPRSRNLADSQFIVPKEGKKIIIK